MMETQPGDFTEITVDETSNVTILDILNEDCWRLILDQVSVKDIVRSECVSRAWQQLVLNYLTGVRNYSIEYSYDLYSALPKRYSHYRSIHLQGHVMLFEEAIKKMGPFIVTLVANCIDEDRLKAIALHCSNLEALTFYRTFRNLSLHHVTKCKQLKRIVFDSCALREDYLQEMVASETIKDLIINTASHVTGRFLTNLRSHLKCLALNRCYFLIHKYVQSAASYLTNLTRLELNKNSSEILQNLHTLLATTPELEYLSLMEYNSVQLPNELPAAIGRLRRLKEIHLWGNENVTDEWLSALCDCPSLRTVNVGRTAVTYRGVSALCRSRPSLEELIVAGLDLTDSDLENCARCCDGLRILDASMCPQLSIGLLKRLAKPRARSLSLWVNFSPDKKDKTRYEGLTVHWEGTTASQRCDYESDSDGNDSG